MLSTNEDGDGDRGYVSHRTQDTETQRRVERIFITVMSAVDVSMNKLIAQEGNNYTPSVLLCVCVFSEETFSLPHDSC